MAITKTTTATNQPLALGLGIFAAALLAMAGVNLFCTFQPMDKRNDKVDAAVVASDKTPFKDRIAQFAVLREEQEKILAKKPTEPFAWARLALLRKSTQNDAKGAMQALRMADMVSPFDPQQTAPRAEMWRNLRSFQTDEEKAYQVTLWQKAAAQNGKQTWDIAVKNSWVKEIEEALTASSNPHPELLKMWVEQESWTGKRQ
jgi:hypothetical protein